MSSVGLGDLRSVGGRSRASAVRGAQTAERSFELLEALVAAGRPLSLSDLSRMVDINKSVGYRLLRALEQRRYIARDSTGRRYEISGGLVALAGKVMSSLSVRAIVRPVMERLSDLTYETVVLYVRYGDQRVCTDVIGGRHPVSRVVRLGTTLPLFVGPSGKVILAQLPDAAREEILRQASAEGALVPEVREHLASILAKGYMAAVGDQTPGIGSLSVAVLGADGVVGSLTISGPGERWTVEAMERVAQDVVREVSVVSESLGGRGEPEMAVV